MALLGQFDLRSRTSGFGDEADIVEMWIRTRLQLESKDQMRARGLPSPDEWDAVALTFAEPVRETPSNFNRVIEYPLELSAPV